MNTQKIIEHDVERYPIAWVVNTKYGVGVSYSDKFWELHPNFYNGKPEPLPELDAEPVMWQYRYKESAYVYSRNSSKWSNWEIVEARIGGTVQSRLDEIQFYNDNDMGQYEIRALYAK